MSTGNLLALIGSIGVPLLLAVAGMWRSMIGKMADAREQNAKDIAANQVDLNGLKTAVAVIQAGQVRDDGDRAEVFERLTAIERLLHQIQGKLEATG